MFIGLWAAMLPLGYAMPYGFLLTLLAEISTLAGFLWLVSRARSAETFETLHVALVLCELVFHTAIVYFLGGVSWLGPIAYLYALLYAVVFFNRQQAAIFTMMVVAAFVFVVTLDGTGVLPHQWYLPQDADRFQDPDFLVPTTIGFVGVMSTVAFWMVFIGSEVRRETDAALQANAELVRAQEDLRRLNDELEKKVEERTQVLAYRAEHDQLTGLLNRGAIQHRSRDLLGLARRGGRPLAMVVVDADNFKKCNDRGGHAYGDRVLIALAQSLRDSCRETDLIGRMGGDEFLLVLPDTGKNGALRFCKRALKRLAKNQGEWPESPPLPDVSIGIGVYPEHGSEFDSLVRVADRAMYEAKAGGGGRSLVGQAGEETKSGSANPAKLAG